jgi:hypothetical protein
VHKGRPFSRSSMWCTHCVGPSLASRINCPLPRHCRRPHSASRQTRWTGSYLTVQGLRPLRLVCNLGRTTPVRPMRRLLGTRFWIRQRPCAEAVLRLRRPCRLDIHPLRRRASATCQGRISRASRSTSRLRTRMHGAFRGRRRVAQV